MEYSQKGFEERRPPMRTQLFQEDNQSSTVEIDLAEYLPLFRVANTAKIDRESQKYKEFRSAHAALFAYFDGMGSSNLMAEMEDICLERYSEAERLKIINSPAYTLLHDSFRELLKNSVDVFLEHHLQNPHDTSTKVKFNFDVQAYKDGIRLIFSDSGSGFSREILKDLENEDKQLQYIHTHQRSKKRSEGAVGLLGGGAFGLRQLIHQVLTGNELKPGKKIPRSRLFDSGIFFSNGTNNYCHGGSIAITTSLAPIPDLENEASTNIEKHRDSKMASSISPETTVSDDSRYSYSSHTIVLDSLNSLDIEEDVKPKKDSLSLDLNILGDTDEMFAGTSPMLPKQAKQFDNLSPVVQKKQHKVRGMTKPEQVAGHSVVPNKHSKRVDQSTSRAKDRPDNPFSPNKKLMALQKKYKLKIASTRDPNDQLQKSKSDQYQGPKKLF